MPHSGSVAAAVGATLNCFGAAGGRDIRSAHDGSGAAGDGGGGGGGGGAAGSGALTRKRGSRSSSCSPGDRPFPNVTRGGSNCPV
jgi:hypothetical protein